MNVVMIMNDTLRYDHVGANGNDWIHTPNLDRFAAESAVFDRHYLASFPTIPNRHELMKGRFGAPFQRWGPLDWDALTLPEVLRDNGYVTMLINDTPHLMNYGYGFDRPFHAWQMIRGHEVDRVRTDYFDEASFPVDTKVQDSARMAAYYRQTKDRQTEADWFSPQVMQAACDWLERNAGHENFFLWVDSFDPHEPWDPPQHYVDLYDSDYQGPPLVWPLFGTTEGRYSDAEMKHIRALFAGEVTMVDHWIGRVIDTIDRLHLREETLVVIMSDHGFGLGERGFLGKRPQYPETVHTLMMVRHPNGIASGKRIPTIAQHPDFVPSILDMLNIEPPTEMGIQGKSWFPVLKGDKHVHRNVAVAGVYPHLIPPNAPFNFRRMVGPDGGWTGMTVVTKDWWLVDNVNPDLRILFNLTSDPAAKTNVLAEHPHIYEELHAEVLKHLDMTKAPAWMHKLWIDGPEGIESPPTDTKYFNPIAFDRGRPHNNPLDGNVTTPD